MPEEPQILAKQGLGWRNILLVALGVLALVLLLLLNYLNIIPLSKNYPKLFGWLPHGLLVQKTVGEKRPIMPCPVPRGFCQNARVVSDGAEFYALGFDLPPGTPIYTTLKGSIVQERVPGRSPSQPLLYLKDSEGREAMYSFYGTVSQPSASILEKGAEIGTVGQGRFPNLPPFDGLNFVFGVKDSTGEYIKLTADNFE